MTNRYGPIDDFKVVLAKYTRSSVAATVNTFHAHCNTHIVQFFLHVFIRTSFSIIYIEHGRKELDWWCQMQHFNCGGVTVEYNVWVHGVGLYLKR